ncbi:MAG: hypothetical protein WCF90_03315 [Methanomicrobiales archaeon]
MRPLLLKYTSLFGIVAFGSLIIGIMSSLFGSERVMRSSLSIVPNMAVLEPGGVWAEGFADTYAGNVTNAPEVTSPGINRFLEAAAANFSPHSEAMVHLT